MADGARGGRRSKHLNGVAGDGPRLDSTDVPDRVQHAGEVVRRACEGRHKASDGCDKACDGKATEGGGRESRDVGNRKSDCTTEYFSASEEINGNESRTLALAERDRVARDLGGLDATDVSDGAEDARKRGDGSRKVRNVGEGDGERRKGKGKSREREGEGRETGD